MDDHRKDKGQEVNTGGGAYIGGGVNTGGGDFVGRDKTVHGDEVGGDKIGIGDISGSQGIAIGRNARATVTGISISSEAKIDAMELRAVLEELWDALGQAQLPPEQTRTTQTAVGNALAAVSDDQVKADRVIENVKKIGDILNQTDTVVKKGSSVWRSMQKLASLIGPLVGGANVVANWFGVQLV